MQNKSTVWLDELRKERLQSSSRNPGVAALMSFFVMGLGQIYAGHVDRGIMLLVVHLTSIFSAISIYSRGLVYETLSPMMSTNALVLSCYIFSVGYILLWIYNIKDAYYLSLFSSFRDWFEVERVLLPMLKVQSENLLAAPQVGEELLEAPAQPAAAKNKVEVPADEAEYIEIHGEATTASVASSASSAKVESAEALDKSENEKNEGPEEVYYADVDPVSFDRQSWKLYVGLALIFVLIGLWFQKEDDTGKVAAPTENETLFAMAADLPDPVVVEQIKETPDSETLTMANQLAAASIETTFVASESLAVNNEAPEEEPVPVQPFVNGLELVSKGDYAAACAEFEKDLTLNRPDKDTWTVILNSFYRSDNKLAYELKLRSYLEDFPRDSASWFNLGKILYDRQAFAEAAQALVQGLKYEPDNVRGNFLLGSIYTDLRLFDDASIYLKKAVEFEPLNREFVFELAKSLNFAGKPAESAKYYQRVLSLDPTHEESIKAIKAINSTLSQDDDENPHTILSSVPEEGKVVIVQGKSKTRVMAKSSLSENDEQEEFASPKTVDKVLEPIGTVLFEAEPVEEEVEEEVEEVLPVETVVEADKKIEVALAKQHVAPSEPVAPSEEDKIRPETEEKNTQKQLQKDPPKIELSRNAGISALEAGLTTAQAGDSSQNAENRQNRDEEVIDDSMMNVVARESAEAHEALEAIRKSAFNEYSRGNWERSLPLYLEYLKKKPDMRAYDVVSIIFEKLKMPNDAFEACEHAYKMGLKELPTLIRLGRLAEETGRYDEGEKYLSQALQQSPHRIDLRIRYARCLAMTGRPDQAVAELESVAQANSSSYSVKTRIANEIKQIKQKAN